MQLLRAIGLFVPAAMLLAIGLQGQAPPLRQWPPDVARDDPRSPALSAEDALATFRMPPGYRLEIVAAEPLVQEPVAMDWDLEGRLWVVEMPGWMPDITAATEHDPVGRVVVLEDTNRDGRMDRRTVFAENLVLARSIKVLDRGVLIGEPPQAWLMVDADGDLRADRKTSLTDQYGRRDVDPQNNANGFDWSLDNIMYTAGQSDIQFRLTNGTFDVQKTLRRGEWGVTHDDAGRVFRNTNESALHVDLVPTFYYARNPALLRTRGSYERLADDNPELNTVWPLRPNPGTNRAYQAGIDRPDGTLVRFTSVCAPLVYRGDRLPADVYGNVFVAEPAANLVSRLMLEEDGTSIRARKAYARGEFLASTDERFRPVYLANAPDGTLYIADLYRGIIEHRISITMYLRDHILSRKLERPTGLGRIYRVVHDSMTPVSPMALARATPAGLVDALSASNGWHRDTAQRLLVERAAKTAAPALTSLVTGAKDWRTRLHALWTLDGLDAIEPGLVMTALDDGAPAVRSAAVRIAERWLGEADDRLQASVLKHLDDPAGSVRQQLAASLGALPASVRIEAIASLLERHGADPVVMDAAISSVRGHEYGVLAKLLALGETPTPQREAAVTMLSATLVRGAPAEDLQRVVAWMADGQRAPWQRSAIVRGFEVTLLGAAMPAPARSPRPVQASPAATLPCPTCPGGRAGPGGAYAFPRPENWPTASAGRGSSSPLRLATEPTALVAAAGSGGELAERVAAILGRMSWPGKGGDVEVTPLTTEEQRRFEAGREVYRNVCQSCHQPDGRGQDKVAPALVGSPFTLGPPAIAVRILVNGKEGRTGLMPPIGASLSNEQISYVLTYVRREWGQTAAPVDPATVERARAETSGRARPWTEEELLKLSLDGR